MAQGGPAVDRYYLDHLKEIIATSCRNALTAPALEASARRWSSGKPCSQP